MAAAGQDFVCQQNYQNISLDQVPLLEDSEISDFLRVLLRLVWFHISDSSGSCEMSQEEVW